MRPRGLLLMNEYPTLLNLTNPPALVGLPSLAVVAREGIAEIERPASDKVISKGNDTFLMKGMGLWGLFKQPHEGGHKAWFFASWLFHTNNTHPQSHLQRLLATDEPNPVSPWSIDWISPVRMSIVWGLRECRMLSCRIVKTDVALLAEGGYDWALPLLAPRRLSGAVRKDASLIQVWGAL